MDANVHDIERLRSSRRHSPAQGRTRSLRFARVQPVQRQIPVADDWFADEQEHVS